MQTPKTDIRKRILTVSKKLFLERGFRDTTTRDIASEAGITLSNLYHYYPSKDDLFRSLLKPATDALEGFKEYYVNKATRLVLDWFKDMKEKHPEINSNVSEFFIHLNNVWMFTLLEEILMHDLPEEETRSALSEYIRFELIGWKKMMQI